MGTWLETRRIPYFDLLHHTYYGVMRGWTVSKIDTSSSMAFHCDSPEEVIYLLLSLTQKIKSMFHSVSFHAPYFENEWAKSKHNIHEPLPEHPLEAYKGIIFVHKDPFCCT
jgi:hypothetical protein